MPTGSLRRAPIRAERVEVSRASKASGDGCPERGMPSADRWGPDVGACRCHAPPKPGPAHEMERGPQRRRPFADTKACHECYKSLARERYPG